MDTAFRNGLRARLPDLTLGLALIGGFWLFYFTTLVIRMGLLGEDFKVLPMRALGCAFGAFLTFLLYLVLRRSARESIRIRVIAAALACLPAAAIFSTFNLAFYVQQPLDTGSVIVHQRVERIPPAGSGAVPVTVERRGRIMVPVSDAKRRQDILRRIADGLVTWYFFFAAWASLYLAISAAGQLRAAERRAARAERQAQEAQLKALRYQVNPHFLFNTLNSLSSLVMARRAEEAETMIVNLSTFFRSSLALDPAEDVTLADEIRFQMLYLDIEKVRFPNRLRVETDIPADLADARVPPLLLQPIVENAIKHGVARSRDPVTVAIRARDEDGRLILTVDNDGAAAEPEREEHGTGVGIINVCERLAARFGDDASCDHGPLPGGGFRVTISMPILGWEGASPGEAVAAPDISAATPDSAPTRPRAKGPARRKASNKPLPAHAR
jgi:two-component system LytT family sensor kinase